MRKRVSMSGMPSACRCRMPLVWMPKSKSLAMGALPCRRAKRYAGSRAREERAMAEAATKTPVTIELMRAISAAFNARDVDRIVSFFTDDATFYLARGPEPVGRTLHGKETIRKALADRFKVIPDMRWDHKEYIL